MLRFSPTRIHLTRMDIDDLDERLQQRQSNRLARPNTSNIRLSPGPGRPTKLSVVSADQNVGCQRAESSSSDVVIEDEQKTASLYEERREILEIEREIAEQSPASSSLPSARSNAEESDLGVLPPATPFAAGAWPSCSRKPSWTREPRPFSSARARRRHARSSEEPAMSVRSLSSRPDYKSQWMTLTASHRRHEGIRPFSTQSQMWLNPVPQLVLPSAPSQGRPDLDPGAPVFVPRTQFANAGSSSPTARSDTLDLRTRSSCELNLFPVVTSLNGPSARHVHPERHVPRHHGGFPVPSPNLERYPLLRPLSAASRGSSTPNLLGPALHPAETHSRGSSLSWRRLPSVAGSASSSVRNGSRQSSLDAAAEFLRMCASPLDDLTERLSRLAAGRPRSVGRSWERSGARRVNLLTGDPFRQEQYSSDAVEVAHPFTKHVDEQKRYREPTEDPVAVAMALPPSSPITRSSQRLSGLPCNADQITSSPRSPLSSRSPDRLPSSPPPSTEIKRKPVPSSAVKVYNDAKPAEYQPQTPADVHHSSRRPRTRSEVAAQQSPLQVGRIMVHSQQLNPHRHTYPTNSTADASQAAARPHAAAASRNRLAASVQRSSENDPENDIGGTLQGLEMDRRTWLGRREHGDLDVTPPREGRFERYLS